MSRSNRIIVAGLDPASLRQALAAGIDPGGNPIEPFIDDEGGWPLRCCLQDSVPGDEIAIIAWSPFHWQGAYREIGPVVVHTARCPGPWNGDALPEEFAARPMTLRPYGAAHTILYDLVTHVPAGDDLNVQVKHLFERPEVDEVYGRNVTGGCFAFVARRA